MSSNLHKSAAGWDRFRTRINGGTQVRHAFMYPRDHRPGVSKQQVAPKFKRAAQADDGVVVRNGRTLRRVRIEA